MGALLTGRRVASFAELERAGDYFGPVNAGLSVEPEARAVFFYLPNAKEPGAPAEQRRVHWVKVPPHTVRECADGSLEIRASIGAQPWWHGYLDEGHLWREC